ncbi:MAG: MoaD/ThiS family protein [Candidatus Woesearchaeota archaeon]
MEITVKIEKDNSTKKINFSGKTVAELLIQLKINSEVSIVTRNNEILTEEELIKPKDKIEILSVVSGG